MKQYVKYLLAILLALLLHEGVTEMGEGSHACASTSSVRCTFSQAPGKQQLLDNIYNHISSQSLCLNLTDSTQVSFNKSTKLLGATYGTQSTAHENCTIIGSYHFEPTPHNPHKYYLFTLQRLLL